MPTLNQDNFDDLYDQVQDIEDNMSSINQVGALMDLVTTYQSSADDSILDLQNRLDDAEAAVESLRRWRVDLRNEMVDEAASNPASDDVTWVVTYEYDPTAPFIVYSGVTRVLASNITVSSVLAESKTFTSSISLSAPVRVTYFKALPNP